MINHKLARLALRTRLLTLSQLPAARAWENVDFTPTEGADYVEENYVPGTAPVLRTTMAQGGTVEETGLYVVKWYTVAGAGIGTIDDGVTALLALFAPGTVITISDGSVLHIRGDVGPSRSQLLQATEGYAVVTVTLPWIARTINAVAA